MPSSKSLGEFELIQRFFTHPLRADSPVRLGVGDDCALLQPQPNSELAISSDMLVEGRHFLSTTDPVRLGHKALAVNLSDLAACGAKPIGLTLALALPRADEAWLAGFSQGLLRLAQAHGCELIGGDTTQGPLNICITVFGEIPLKDGRSQALLRSGARPGDDVYVSGTLGDARLALEVFRGTVQVPGPVFEAARARLEQPTPRVALGQALRGQRRLRHQRWLERRSGPHPAKFRRGCHAGRTTGHSTVGRATLPRQRPWGFRQPARPVAGAERRR